MKKVKVGQMVRFKSIDDFTGEEVILTGKIIGDAEAVRKRFPEECGEAPDGTYLVKVEGRGGLHVVYCSEIVSVGGS